MKEAILVFLGLLSGRIAAQAYSVWGSDICGREVMTTMTFGFQLGCWLSGLF